MLWSNSLCRVFLKSYVFVGIHVGGKKCKKNGSSSYWGQGNSNIVVEGQQVLQVPFGKRWNSSKCISELQCACELLT